MGRLPDPPGLQAAKGNPGRRKSAVAKRIEEAERVAALLGRAPIDGAEPPALIQHGPTAVVAVAVWRELAPRLAETQRLQKLHRSMFATFCVYFAEWVLANEDIQAKGHTQNVKTVAGGRMERLRPIVAIRDHAFERVMKLSERFGLTPSDEYAVFKDQAIAAVQNPGLFDGQVRPGGREDAGAKAETPAEQGAGASGYVGVLDRLDSAPPGSAIQ